MNSLQPMTAERKNDAGTEGDTSHSCPAICSASRSKYKTIVADPPWAMTRATGNGFGRRDKQGNRILDGVAMKTVPLDYPTMSIEEICALPVRELAEADAHLYLWTTQSFLRRTYEVLDAWGFRQGAMLVWSKPPMGVCGTYVCSAEFCIFARRGSLQAKRRQLGTVYQWPRTKHSEKPEAFQDMVESVSPGPYLELFARRTRLGWHTWGNQSLCHVELVTPNKADMPHRKSV